MSTARTNTSGQHTLWAIANRLSLRPPQRESLEILDRVCELLPLEKEADTAQALEAIRSVFPSISRTKSSSLERYSK